MKINKKVGIVFLAFMVFGAIGNVAGCASQTSGSSGKESVSSESVAESKAEQEATPTAAPTETPTPAPTATEVPVAVKSQRNGFDEATNQVIDYHGFSFSIPSYMTATEDEKGNLLFAFNGETQGTTNFVLGRAEVAISAEEFESKKTDLINGMLKEGMTWQNISPITIAGCSGMVGTNDYSSEAGQEALDIYLWYEANSPAIFTIIYYENAKSMYTYTDDLQKIVASAIYTGGDAASEAVSEPVEETAEGDVPAGVTPEFKEQMDQYEAFFDEYVEFMQTYSETDDPIALMGQYLDFLQKYNEYMAALDAIDEAELSDADALYFAEVSLRIEEKLLNVASSLY